jgi:ribosome modulation factor
VADPHAKTTPEVLRARGAAAMRAGRQRSQCPYEGTVYRREWQAGWDEADREMRDVFKQGYRAFGQGLHPYHNNPYHDVREAAKHRKWYEGFEHAQTR